MSLFNDNHKRTLRSRFEYVDGLLGEAVRFLDAAQPPSPFSDHVPDASPVQQKVISDYAARLRGEMRRFMENHGIDLPRPHVSSVWSARTTLNFAEIAIEELKPRYMRGYGGLPEEAAHELNLLVTQLADLLHRMEGFLAQGAGKDLRARLERLERTADELELLRKLENVITAHGLVEFRPSLGMLIERLESATFEVAVFGRVSSGKSSLLDFLLQTDVLPVGVTPVTAIPTRIAHGQTPRAVIHFAEGSPVIVEPQHVADFVTEQRNPANAKHVTRVQIELPSPRLQEGITFVDTPGLSSLAASGAAESLAYLPRCDLGIVLIDASSTLVPDDVALVHTLYQAGAGVMVLLSKADTLAAEDRDRVAGYVREQLLANLGLEAPVYLVSVKDGATAMADRWIDEALTPALAEHRRLAMAAFRRKVGALREAVVAAIKRRLDRREVPRIEASRWQEAEKAMATALARLDEASRPDSEAIRPAGESVDKILDEFARITAADWNGSGDVTRDLTASVVALLQRTGRELAAASLADVAEIRQSLASSLRLACRVAGCKEDDEERLPMPRGVPVLDGLSVPPFEVRRPALARLNAGILQHRIRKQADAALRAAMTGLLDEHQKRLADWQARYIQELRLAFVARFDYYRAQADDRPEAANQDGAGLQAALAELATADSPATAAN
jgi:GTP-binding protein EngB required for normal cell division